MNHEELGDKVFSLINETYSNLKQIYRPSIRSNGMEEWTVLASVVAIDKNNQRLRLISLGTGVKAVPDENLKRSEGKMIHDSHAEILAIRGFNTVLLRQIEQLKQNGDVTTDLLQTSEKEGKYKIIDSWKFGLYVSKIPCGNASMNILCERTNDAIQLGSDDESQYLTCNNKTILRGRTNYSKKDVVRTKPGRKDSKMTLSKSCSDKISIKQVLSILNSMNWELFESPVYLDYLFLPSICDQTLQDIARTFNERVNCFQTFKKLQLISCKKQFKNDQQTTEQFPSLVSCCLINVIENECTFEEAILNGVKYGFYTKGKKPLRKNCESVVSRYSQWSIFKRIRPEYMDLSYLQFKSKQISRNSLKEQIRLHLSSDGWISTHKDDCF